MIGDDVKRAAEGLIDLGQRIRKWALEGEALLTEVQAAGVELRQSDADALRTRFFEQLPYALQFKAGALLPPVTASATIVIDDLQARAG
jgi:hypothetical protein